MPALGAALTRVVSMALTSLPSLPTASLAILTPPSSSARLLYCSGTALRAASWSGLYGAHSLSVIRTMLALYLH
ncbi:MAG: hypothetical protein LM590_03255 [Thermofilum sp.]|nr:hypothetical protein [Thermofilum sp.]